MKIFDCVTFFEEERLMSLRFNILNSYVDKFIVCESLYDHRGRRKKINFNKKKFPLFEKKIVHTICKKFPPDIGPWERQAFQREHILKVLNIATDEDLIMFSDPDEIPNPKALKNIQLTGKYGIFLQKLFYYKLNLQDKKLGCNWEGTRISKKKNLKSINYLRQKVIKKNLKYGFWRIDKEKNIQLINNGGWHFSYLLTPREIKKKIQTFAHTEFDLDEFTNYKNIKNCIKKGLDLFKRNVIYKQVKIDKTYPDYIKENTKLLKQWIAFN
tara:strand:- start:2089 stop:2898 length:810 start_codon:yes stop_codon:yes gene_type:complete